MTITENEKNVETTEVQQGEKSTTKQKFTFLVFMASVLSIGSLAWTTWSMLDLFKVDALLIEKMGNISLIGLSAAITMDIFWSATMVAEYRGQKLPFTWRLKKGDPFHFNALPLLGWVEVLFVAGLLGYHGSTLEGEAAAFAAVLPIFTKFTWMLALNGLKDPYDLTDDEKAMLAAKKRKSRLTRADAEATAEQHDADMIMKQREHEAALAEEHRKADIEREKVKANAEREEIQAKIERDKVKAKIEREKLERDAEFEAERARLEGENDLKAMRQRLNAQLQIATLRTQSEIELERMDAETDLRLRSPLGLGNIIQGKAITQPQASQPQLTQGGESDILSSLSDAEQKRANLAARFHEADYVGGSITKVDFCKANNIMHPSRLSEATKDFPAEWFIKNGLAYWMK